MTIPVTIAFSVMCAKSVTVAAVAAEKGDPPGKTTDGLELVKQTKQRLVYARPEADLSQHTNVAILDCHVAFKKN